MNIVSLVVRVRPERLPEVRARLDGIPGVEVHGEAPEGRLVVTVEDLPGVSTSDTVLKVHQVQGVVAITLAYEYCDDGLDDKLAA